MIIPYGTDAPIYHWPYATVGLIVVNTALLPFSIALVDHGYALDLGVGLHPLQWVTNNFLHGGLMHLVGNMIFLWAYGIVVEGKLGWWPFLIAYLAIGTAYGALVQGLYLGAAPIDGDPPHVLGASAVIFGLLGMCVVWAPKNCLSCFVFLSGWFRWFADVWEIPILVFAAFQVGLEVIWLLVLGATGLEILSSAFLHVCGFGIGLGLGIVLLNRKWVDCEGWDLFAITRKHFAQGSGLSEPARRIPRYLQANRSGRTKRRRDRQEIVEEVPAEERGASALERIRKRLDAGETLAALDLSIKSAPTWRSWNWRLPEPDLLRLIKAAQAIGLETESVPLMFDYVKSYPEKADRVRLRLAQNLIKQQRPARALQLLEEVAPGSLPDELEQGRHRLIARAKALLAEGVLELQGDD
jgi:membrane associated rhomboid family serine protease